MKNDDIWTDFSQTKHNHEPVWYFGSGIKEDGSCPRCNEWIRWHEKSQSHLPEILGKGEEEIKPKRGRRKKNGSN